MNETGGRFRKKKTNFSIVSNEILRDENMSLRAKGLYSIIQSYITLDNFILYKGFLMSKCPEGRRAFDGAWNELKNKGYLMQYRMKDEQNHFYYEYDLLDFPVTQNDTTENPGVTFCASSNCAIHKTRAHKTEQYNNTEQNNTLNNNTNPIISIEDVREQIGFTAFSGTPNVAIVDDIVTLMHEVYNMPDYAVLRINRNSVSAKTVKERFQKLTYSHMQYVLLVLNSYSGEIGNHRNFMLTTLFNAIGTMGVYFQNRVNHDLYGEQQYQ